MKHILIINGLPRSGKDTFIDILHKIAKESIFRYSSIDYIKSIAKEKLNWKGTKDPKDREFLAKLKDLATWYDNIPFKKIIEKEELFSSVESSYIFCTCVREPKEIQKLVEYYEDKGDKENCNVKTIFIMRNDVEKEQSNEADNNVFNYIYDYYIYNNSDIKEYKDNIELFYKELVKYE